MTKKVQPFAEDDKTDPGIIVPEKPVALPKARLSEVTTSTHKKIPPIGKIDALLADPSITEIMINDTRNIMIEQKGKLEKSALKFDNIEELNRTVRMILEMTGKILTPDLPYVDTSLPDGSRVHIVGPPLVKGASITIRKFPDTRMPLELLVQRGTLSQKAAYFLYALVRARANILISGGTGSGKTTLLNSLLDLVPESERVITIEDIPELKLGIPNSVAMITKPQSPGSAPVTARDLIVNALRMRPDRIVIGECRRGEAFDMLQAMNTGHEGSLATIHANTARDGLSRLETLALLAGQELPILSIRKQMAQALDFLVHIRRLKNGQRTVDSICEVTGIEGDTLTTQEIFHWDQNSNLLVPTGLLPREFEKWNERMHEETGNELSRSLFM